MLHPILSIIILLEILFSCFIVWGILNAEKLVNFENQIIIKIIKAVKNEILLYCCNNSEKRKIL